MKRYVFNVKTDDIDERVDTYISRQVNEISRTYVQKLIREKRLFLTNPEDDDEITLKQSYRLKKGDSLVLEVPNAILPPIKAENIPLDILYEDEHILVVNKPKGMVVHPAPGNWNKTLVNALLYHCRDNLSGINGVLRPGIVHRLDRDTTGVIIVCKNDFAHQEIAKQFAERTLEKNYLALLHGRLHNIAGYVNCYVGRNLKNRKKMAVYEVPHYYARLATTDYKVIQCYKKHTLIKCTPVTGRTHQIRVVMEYLKQPIVGDTVYSKIKDKYSEYGQFLHASSITFTHPTGEVMTIEAPLPDYFENVLKELR
ncbi:MAG: RluA family pseudouridine synthase [Lachnospiraceae bacterium]|jgi:23S rRNA pseudouridine1911/1915/1917 synthase|nr:RluA family pseudouridine synthase [Lachnospiraceae bacterium]